MMVQSTTSSLLSDLQCARCGHLYPVIGRQTLSVCCQQPLLARYDLKAMPSTPWQWPLEATSTMWRFSALLPVSNPRNQVSLGEGNTPLLNLSNLSKQYGFKRLTLKDEGLNPTGSFKARGLSAAISMAKENGVEACIIPTAGNAGVAMAAYCARAGMEAVVVMPRHTPDAFKDECQAYGAQLILVDGLISDCAGRVRQLNEQGHYFDVSTLKEPYRLEGKKTMGFEIAEQLAGQLPDVLVYPAGGGTGLIGIWKAFAELQQIGWLPPGQVLPRMVAAQAQQCCPLVRTFTGQQPNCSQYVGQPTIANGLAVPRPIGEPLMVQVLRESNGTALAISESDMVENTIELSANEGIFAAPEGGATWAAAKQLLHTGWIQPDEHVLLLNTGSGQKYMENLLKG